MQIEKVSNNKLLLIPDRWIVWRDIFGNIDSVESTDGRLFKISRDKK